MISEKESFYPAQDYISRSTDSDITYIIKGSIKNDSTFTVYTEVGVSSSIYENDYSFTEGVSKTDSFTIGGTQIMAISYDGDKTITITKINASMIQLTDIVYQTNASLNSVLSHLADINWPYPTGTVHYYDTSALDLKNSLAGTPRYAGYDVGSGNECQTTTGYYNAAYCDNTYITSNALVWNSTNVDTSKANSYWINKTSTYIDIYLEFYAKTTITTANTWIIATINASVIDYKFSYNPVYFGCIMNDGSGTFSEVYMTRTGSDGDTGNLEIRGVGSVAKGKGTGIGTGYLTYVQIRLLPNSYNSSEDYDLRSTGIGQTIVSA